ncbi:MAG: 30S ribosomal protein S12 methylthiotransferase RimO [Acetivibrionales bacterium]|jgi:ribosomal protein S12 methylthiotransferase
MVKVGIVSLGCPKNLVDSEIMLGILKSNNFEVTDDESLADIIIVNTCGFIESAKQESINTILEMSQYKEKNCELLIVTGCLSERYKDEMLEEIPEIDAVIGTRDYANIVSVIQDAYDFKEGLEVQRNHCNNSNCISYLDNERLLSTKSKGYAYIKISEGCDNCCTYCIIPQLRGAYRSRKIESIVLEAKSLAQAGIKEVILIAQDTTRYGTDIYGSRKLVELIKEISRVDGIEWIRLLYCYPELIDDYLVNEIKTNDKVCKYLDIPIQHASEKILKAMGRRGSIQQVRNLIHNLRNTIPHISIRTTLIVGFPGEDKKDFEELYSFVEDMKFDRLGVFTYSKEEGTPAAKMKGQIPEKVKKNREHSIMSLQKKISRSINTDRLGRTYKALVEGVSEDGLFYYGRTYAEAPGIDGTVYFTSREPLDLGTFATVKILNIEDYDLIGEVIYELTE